MNRRRVQGVAAAVGLLATLLVPASSAMAVTGSLVQVANDGSYARTIAAGQSAAVVFTLANDATSVVVSAPDIECGTCHATYYVTRSIGAGASSARPHRRRDPAQLRRDLVQRLHADGGRLLPRRHRDPGHGDLERHDGRGVDHERQQRRSRLRGVAERRQLPAQERVRGRRRRQPCLPGDRHAAGHAGRPAAAPAGTGCRRRRRARRQRQLPRGRECRPGRYRQRRRRRRLRHARRAAARRPARPPPGGDNPDPVVPTVIATARIAFHGRALADEATGLGRHAGP